MTKPERFRDGDEVFTSNKYSVEMEEILKRNNWYNSVGFGFYTNPENVIGYLNAPALDENSIIRWGHIIDCGYLYHLINYSKDIITEMERISLCKTAIHTSNLIELTKVLYGKFNYNITRFFDLIVSPNIKEIFVKVPYKTTSQYFVVACIHTPDYLEERSFQLPSEHAYSLDHNEEVYLAGSCGYTEEECRNEWVLRELRK